MSVTRTTWGISNSAKFFGASYVIYVEGKTQDSDNSVASPDALFWERVLARYAPELDCKIICRGSKKNLIPLAEKVVNGEVSNTFIAMDRDYDPEIGTVFDHDAVLYTYGYSWENDVWSDYVVHNIAHQNSLVRPVPEEVINRIVSIHDDFLRKCRRVGRVNLAAAVNGGEYVLTKKDHRALVSLRKNAPPSFCSSYLLRKISSYQKREGCDKYTSGVSVDPRLHCLGHLVAFFTFHLLCYYLRKLGHCARVDFDFFTTLAINCFSESISARADGKADRHYRLAVSRLPID